MSDLERIFAPEGPLAAAVAGFRPRPQQLEMAQRIAAAITGGAGDRADSLGLSQGGFAVALQDGIADRGSTHPASTDIFSGKH